MLRAENGGSVARTLPPFLTGRMTSRTASIQRER